MKVRITKDYALIIVDVQYDSMPGGALPVPDGDRVVPVLNKYIKIFTEKGAQIVASRDWHPENHSSFKEYGGIWPSHCVQNTHGAMFHSDLQLPENTYIVSKATHPDKDAYSAFSGTDLAAYLKEKNIKRVFIGGLATDYCVKATVLDAIKEGFCTFFLEDASKGVDVNKGDVDRAIDEMLEHGGIKLTISDII